MINIEPIEAFSDNYIWLLTTNEGSIVIDPGESQNLLKILKENNLNLKAILITHHHFDHTGGINEILSEKSIDVYGPNSCFIFLLDHDTFLVKFLPHMICCFKSLQSFVFALSKKSCLSFKSSGNSTPSEKS